MGVMEEEGLGGGGGGGGGEVNRWSGFSGSRNIVIKNKK